MTTFSNVLIQSHSNTTLIYCDSISFQANNLTLIGNSFLTDQGGGLAFYNCISLYITSSLFQYLAATYGGALYIEQSDSYKQSSLASPNY